jgi:hypothetical protein
MKHKSTFFLLAKFRQEEKLKIKNSKMKYSINFNCLKWGGKKKLFARCLYSICSVEVIATMQEPNRFKYGDFKPFFFTWNIPSFSKNDWI